MSDKAEKDPIVDLMDRHGLPGYECPFSEDGKPHQMDVLIISDPENGKLCLTYQCTCDQWQMLEQAIAIEQLDASDRAEAVRDEFMQEDDNKEE